MANGKFWVLIYDGKPVSFKRFYLGGGYDRYIKLESLKEAERAATEYTKKYGDDVYIMESVAFATVPTTIVKIEG